MMILGRVKRLVPGVVVALVLVGGALSPQARAAEPISFNYDVLPILNFRCLECHVPGEEGYEASGLDLRTYEGVMKGTQHGPVVVPGSAFTSNLMVLIEGRAAQEIRMPHNRKQLTKCERDIIRRWINRGAKND